MAADDCGNETSHLQVVQVEDNTAPVLLSGASDLEVQCDGRRQPRRTRTLARVWWWRNGQRKLRGRGLDQQPCWIHGDLWRQCPSRAVHRHRRLWSHCHHHSTFSVVDTIVPEWNEALPPSYMEVECGSAPEAAVLTVTDNCGFIPVDSTRPWATQPAQATTPSPARGTPDPAGTLSSTSRSSRSRNTEAPSSTFLPT